ncbi:MAG: 3-octaprenyl-4-hydroxybenzoate carboxy-lyase [Candidatus Thorarchaeota archaeon AB_25]|nr:MAG: 3-octaprenyl-4-hydroxybenzoate carboxy-lyase [Candidatus Thorarchaeota archaeon AB_25]
MILEEYIKKLQQNGKITTVSKSISRNLEIAGVLSTLEPEPVLFENVEESEFRVAGNLFCNKIQVADYFGITTEEIIPTLANAIKNRSEPEHVENAPCQEVVEAKVDLDKLPILIHNKVDGGPYISSGVVVASDPEYGQNLDFHRAMQISKDRMVARVVRGRDFHKFLERNGEVDVVFCVGNTAEVLIAAATSVETGINELEIANALSPIRLTKAKTVDLMIPADCEFVLEGKIILEEKHDEGPFIDLTETVDVIRQEPIFEVKKITHRKNAIWQGLLPGRLEHKILMGMPREPTVFKKIQERGINVLDVYITPGGASWLHVAVKVQKKNEDDGLQALEAAFAGHRSAKHIWVYDEDIDIYSDEEREWAMATRFQADVDLLIKDPEPGSSLDPSAEPGTKLTTKCGFDCTKVLESKGKSFGKAKFPEVDLKKYLGE